MSNKCKECGLPEDFKEIMVSHDEYWNLHDKTVALKQQLKEAREVIEWYADAYYWFPDRYGKHMWLQKKGVNHGGHKAQLWLKKYGEGNENNTM